jgi:hypothetical protein
MKKLKSLAQKVVRRIKPKEHRMRIGVITNLVLADNFVRNSLSTASTQDWMVTLGGNTGNIAFVEGILKSLGDDYDIIGWGDDTKATHQHYDHIVVCCANQIGAHFNLSTWARVLEEYNLPTTLIGLGAQADNIGDVPEVNEGAHHFLQVVDSLRNNPEYSNIISRGDYSASVLASLGAESKPFGCPSQFISDEVDLGKLCLQHQDETSVRIMTAAGNPWGKEYKFEKTLTELADLYHGDYVLQHPQSLLKIATPEFTSLDDSALERVMLAYSHLGDIKDIHRWFKSNSITFADVQNWMHYSRRFSSVIGPRYHGIAIPIQAGVPGKVITIDSRTQELSQATGIPFIPYNTVEFASPKDLSEICRWEQEDADRLNLVRVDNAYKYISFLKENGLKESSQLSNLAKGGG